MGRGWKAGATLLLAVIALAPATQAGPLDALNSPYDADGHYDAATNSFVLTWETPPGSPPGTTYQVYRDLDFLGTVADVTFTDANLPNAPAWTYSITAQYDAAESSPAILVVVNVAWSELPPPQLPFTTLSISGGPSSPEAGPEFTPRDGVPRLLEMCPLIAVGWRPNPPYLFGIHDDCLEGIIPI